MKTIHQQLQELGEQTHAAHEANFYPREIARGQRVLRMLLALYEVSCHAQDEGIYEMTIRNHTRQVTVRVNEEAANQVAPRLAVLPTGCVSDITCLPLVDGNWAYLCSFQDVASKYVVGWHVMVTVALQRAFLAQPPTPELLVHSDRGGQYCANAYRALLARHGAVRSQIRRRECYDNAQIATICTDY